MRRANKVIKKLPEAAFFDFKPQIETREKAPASQRISRLMNPESIKQEVFELIENGEFEFDAVEAMQDSEFIQLLIEMPAKYAVRVYAAEKRAEDAENEAMIKLADRLKSREMLPKSAKAGAGGVPAWDYANMSDEEFAALERHLKDQARRGIHVRL